MRCREIKRSIPDMFTAFRCFAAVLMLFFDFASPLFYILYFLCGLTDMLDGFAARKLGVQTRYGEVFDSTADVIFAVCTALKLILCVKFERYVLPVAGFICIVKLFSFIYVHFCLRKKMILHTVSNKAAGFLVFVSVPLLNTGLKDIFVIITCIFSLYAAFNELYLNTE